MKGLSIKKDEGRHGGHQGSGDSKVVMKAEEAREVLAKILDDDLRLMGMDPKESRPEWMIIEVLCVAPPPVRPSV